MTWAHLMIAAAALFAVGAAVGSFLNVCAHRIPAGLSVWRPASRCPRCGAAIAVRDNVPVLGWLLLRGRCRRCRAPISPRYPAVEALTGALLAGAYLAGPPAGLGDLLAGDVLGAAARLVAEAAGLGLVVTAALIAHDARRLRPR